MSGFGENVKFCCGCLCTDAIFYKMTRRHTNILADFLGVKIRNNGWATNICGMCDMLFAKCIRFREQCLEAKTLYDKMTFVTKPALTTLHILNFKSPYQYSNIVTVNEDSQGPPLSRAGLDLLGPSVTNNDNLTCITEKNLLSELNRIIDRRKVKAVNQGISVSKADGTVVNSNVADRTALRKNVGNAVSGIVIDGTVANKNIADRTVISKSIADGIVINRNVADGIAVSKSVADGIVISKIVANGTVDNKDLAVKLPPLEKTFLVDHSSNVINGKHLEVGAPSPVVNDIVIKSENTNDINILEKSNNVDAANRNNTDMDDSNDFEAEYLLDEFIDSEIKIEENIVGATGVSLETPEVAVIGEKFKPPNVDMKKCILEVVPNMNNINLVRTVEYDVKRLNNSSEDAILKEEDNIANIKTEESTPDANMCEVDSETTKRLWMFDRANNRQLATVGSRYDGLNKTEKRSDNGNDYFNENYWRNFDEKYNFTSVVRNEEEILKEFVSKQFSEKYINAQHKCHICFEVFASEKMLLKHLDELHNTKNKYACKYCNKRYMSVYSLKYHISEDHTLKFTCNICSMVTRSRMSSISHNQLHKQVFFECPYCEEIFRRRFTYRRHIRSAHPEKASWCRFCGVACLKMGLHMARKHRELLNPFLSFCCDSCGVQFVSRRAFQVHKAFCLPHGVWCVRCGLRYPTEDHLRRHLLRAHRIPTPKMRWKKPHRRLDAPKSREKCMCEYCGKVLPMHSIQSHLKEHKEQPYDGCDRCEKRFSSWGALEAHAATHGGSGANRCGHCGEAFATKAAFAMHTAIHASEPYKHPFPCLVCKKMFKSRESMHLHLEVAHQQLNIVYKKVDDDQKMDTET